MSSTNEKKGDPQAAARSRANAERVAQDWHDHQGKGMDGSYRTTVSGRDVVIRDIQFGEDDDGRTWVDVWTGNTHRPTLRIANPPTLVRDSRGPIGIKEEAPNGTIRTVRYREDPVEAVAEVLAKVRTR